MVVGVAQRSGARAGDCFRSLDALLPVIPLATTQNRAAVVAGGLLLVVLSSNA
jgi:hypothetical protein